MTIDPQAFVHRGPWSKVCLLMAGYGGKGPDPDVNVIAERLRNVKRKILILSGKGGVGELYSTQLRCVFL